MGKRLDTIAESTGRKASGYCTPIDDKSPQKMCLPGKRVIPIIFIPGIMGSNLRLSNARQKELGKSNNIAWNTDKLPEMLEFRDYSAARRQLQLDQSATEVEVYEPKNNPTGNANENADQRHSAVELSESIKSSKSSGVLHDSASKARHARTIRYRGWGEVFFGSYRTLLEACELSFNDFSSQYWNGVLDTDPSEWGALQSFSLKPINRSERDKALMGCTFPVHAIGYNWLQTNLMSAVTIRTRLDELMERYRRVGFDCRKVVIVTHSMGGLVARALVHPSIGNYADKVLGIVHGVMPAVGAPAAYKRIRCGVEGGPEADVLGNSGMDVSAVLANSPGGLELLPSPNYGNGWLKIRQGGVVLKSLPKNGDPYDEIYQLRGKWYGLLVDEWLNPAFDVNAGIAKTTGLLANAKYFHKLIADTYHPNSYAHYGIDPERPSWETITWKVDANGSKIDADQWRVSSDRGRGSLSFLTGESSFGVPKKAQASLEGATGAGDQTVPSRSAEAQLRSGLFKGVFEQHGYEHQLSYKDANALNSTIYSIVRIVQAMKWEE